MPITSLVWPSPGTHFIAGTTNRIAVFDVSRPDDMSAEPLLTIPTIPSARHISKGHGVGMKGTVSALGVSPVREGDGMGLVAAGTWTRQLGLYDLQRAGACVATWGVAGAADAEQEVGKGKVGGRGIMQTVWSPCGRYLVVNERQSRGLLVYDLRGTHRLLACLMGRNGMTNQRLSCDVFPGTERVGGFEVWAGTMDGGVKVWEGVGNREGVIEPTWEWQAHETAVGSAAMHMSGSVLATCSGTWRVVDHESSDEESEEEESDEVITVSDDDSEEEEDDSEEDDSENDSENDSEDDSEEDSDEEKSVCEISSGPRQRPISRRHKTVRVPIVVDETSLKVWSIAAGGGPSGAQRPS